MPADLDVDVKDCASCGGDHGALTFEQLPEPVLDDGGMWTHRVLCPTTGEPLTLGRLEPKAAA